MGIVAQGGGRGAAGGLGRIDLTGKEVDELIGGDDFRTRLTGLAGEFPLKRISAPGGARPDAVFPGWFPTRTSMSPSGLRLAEHGGVYSGLVEDCADASVNFVAWPGGEHGTWRGAAAALMVGHDGGHDAAARRPHSAALTKCRQRHRAGAWQPGPAAHRWSRPRQSDLVGAVSISVGRRRQLRGSLVVAQAQVAVEAAAV